MTFTCKLQRLHLRMQHATSSDCSTKQQFKARRKIALSSTYKRERDIAAIKEQQAAAPAAHAADSVHSSPVKSLSREQSAFMGDSSGFGSNGRGPAATPINMEASLAGSVSSNTSHSLSQSLRDSRTQPPARAMHVGTTAVRQARVAEAEGLLSDDLLSAEAKAFLEMQHALDLEV
jgi:hypothetical protein